MDDRTARSRHHLSSTQVALETRQEFAKGVADQMARTLEKKAHNLEWQLRLEQAAAAGVRLRLAGSRCNRKWRMPMLSQPIFPVPASPGRPWRRALKPRFRCSCRAPACAQAAGGGEKEGKHKRKGKDKKHKHEKKHKKHRKQHKKRKHSDSGEAPPAGRLYAAAESWPGWTSDGFCGPGLRRRIAAIAACDYSHRTLQAGSQDLLPLSVHQSRTTSMLVTVQPLSAAAYQPACLPAWSLHPCRGQLLPQPPCSLSPQFCCRLG
jgi:hypothetical protein